MCLFEWLKDSSYTLSPSHTPLALSLLQFECLKDNYGYLVHDPASGQSSKLFFSTHLCLLECGGETLRGRNA
jgi:hypothetical protein